MSKIQKWANFLKNMPIHPQWSIGKIKPPEAVKDINGFILDIGVADCWIESHLSSHARYIALDYPVTGQEMYGAKPHVFANGASLPFRDCQFDLEMIEHVPDPHQVLAEIFRVLKNGGKAWISMPFLYQLHDAPFDFQRFTEVGMKSAALRAGLEIFSIQRAEHSIRTAGLLFCLAIAGGADAVNGRKKYALLPIALLAIFVVNLCTWLLSLVWPDWSHMTHGHIMQVRNA
jgi:SAM-dependent methyltransferase